jgi:hypothetical protein
MTSGQRKNPPSLKKVMIPLMVPTKNSSKS